MKKLVLAVIALGFSVGVNAACDTKSMNGDYSFGAVGQNSGYTAASIGTINFNGKGVAKIHGMAGYGTDTFTSDNTASYMVNANCMGSITAADGTTLNFVIDKLLKTGQLFLSQNGALAFGTLTKQ
jgi:hypothetical protein